MNFNKLKLQPKQERFCREYVIDLNATQAAIRAGYSEKTASETASRLLTFHKVTDKINKLKADLAKTSTVEAMQIVNEQKNIAFSNIADIYESWTQLKEFDLLTEEQKAAIKSINTKTIRKRVGTVNGEPEFADVEYVKIEMHDKVKALETLSKMLGHDQPQRLEITGADGQPLFEKLDLSKLSDEELITLHALTKKASANDNGAYPV